MEPESQAFLAGATFNPAFLPTEDVAFEPQVPEPEISAEDPAVSISYPSQSHPSFMFTSPHLWHSATA